MKFLLLIISLFLISFIAAAQVPLPIASIDSMVSAINSSATDSTIVIDSNVKDYKYSEVVFRNAKKEILKISIIKKDYFGRVSGHIGFIKSFYFSNKKLLVITSESYDFLKNEPKSITKVYFNTTEDQMGGKKMNLLRQSKILFSKYRKN